MQSPIGKGSPDVSIEESMQIPFVTYSAQLTGRSKTGMRSGTDT